MPVIAAMTQHAAHNAMEDPDEIAWFHDRCSDLMRELLGELARAPGTPRPFPQIEDALGWIGKLDSGTLKLKVAASIVAISSIHLLRIFMQADKTENDKIMWYVILHMTFVLSAVLLGVLDRMSFAAHRDK